jgi:hypothetical protein
MDNISEKKKKSIRNEKPICLWKMEEQKMKRCEGTEGKIWSPFKNV